MLFCHQPSSFRLDVAAPQCHGNSHISSSLSAASTSSASLSQLLTAPRQPQAGGPGVVRPSAALPKAAETRVHRPLLPTHPCRHRRHPMLAAPCLHATAFQRLWPACAAAMLHSAQQPKRSAISRWKALPTGQQLWRQAPCSPCLIACTARPQRRLQQPRRSLHCCNLEARQQPCLPLARCRTSCRRCAACPPAPAGIYTTSACFVTWAAGCVP